MSTLLDWKKCGVVECFRDHICHNKMAGRECLVKTRRSSLLHHFAWRISIRAQEDELLRQCALGADWIDAYAAAWRIMDEVHDLVLAPDKPAVHLPAKMISNPNSTWGRT